MVDTDIKLIGFDYVNSETAAEIYRNLKMLFSTLEGTCAGDRNYGINPESHRKQQQSSTETKAVTEASMQMITEP